jgi:hypothetical protein
VTARTAAKAYTFHFDPGVRREDKIKAQKQKQREWMAKMYADKGTDKGSTGGAGGAGGGGAGAGGRASRG